jgi:chromosome segregation ATPase
LEQIELRKELNNAKLQLQSANRENERLINNMSDLKRKVIELESENETLKSQMVGVPVLKKTNERLYSELTTLQNQLKKLESMNSSNFSMLNSGLQFNQSKPPIYDVPEERPTAGEGMELIDQLDKL